MSTHHHRTAQISTSQPIAGDFARGSRREDRYWPGWTPPPFLGDFARGQRRGTGVRRKFRFR